jgi:hypothetical protein
MIAMLASIGATDVNGVTRSADLPVAGLAGGARARMVVVAIANEAMAQLPSTPSRQADGSWRPGGGAGLSSLDLNGDTSTGVGAPVAPASTLVIPIKVLVSWRPRSWAPGQDEAWLEQVFLLY